MRYHLLDETIWPLAKKALTYGGTRKSLYKIEWNVHARCERPRVVELSGRACREEIDPTKGKLAMGLDISVSCRKCASCLRARAWLWTRRARQETAGSQRTWFGTITLSAENHSAVANILRRAEREQGFDFDAYTQDRQFQLRHAVVSAELTRFVKRVRKNSGAKIRYLLVAERHKSGLPHYHVLLHEVMGTPPVTKRTLDGAWRWGFTKWKLVDGTAHAGYVTKYLAKSSLARVRASLDYGDSYGDLEAQLKMLRVPFQGSHFNVKERPPENHTSSISAGSAEGCGKPTVPLGGDAPNHHPVGRSIF